MTGTTRHAVAPVGEEGTPLGFSQGFVVNLGNARLVSIAGQVAVREGRLVGRGDVAAQAECCYRRIAEIVAAAGGTMADVVASHVYLLDISSLAQVARVRRDHLGDPPPASTAVEVSGLAIDGALVEIDATAVIATG
jgi:2-iminobutanoate/2-iminopropanoate deaminase